MDGAGRGVYLTSIQGPEGTSAVWLLYYNGVTLVSGFSGPTRQWTGGNYSHGLYSDRAGHYYWNTIRLV